jgi:acetolactate synthase-1/2/3 large subunit
MSDSAPPLTGADLLVQRLDQHGVRYVFGYPGGQMTPIYDALARQSQIRHILARDEQAAAFMADGYARATGKPGVCLAVCGPGVYNAATPLATAFTDSIPVLLISGQVASVRRGLRSGCYHENDQINACATFTKLRYVASMPEVCADALDLAFAAMTSGRPGPVLLEAPLDMQRLQSSHARFAPLVRRQPPQAPALEGIDALVGLIGTWKRPLLLAGGGVSGAEALLAQLADRLASPVIHTFMGKCALSSEHPLHRGLPWRQATSDLTEMEAMMSPLFAEADGLLAIGCRFSQAATGSWVLKPPASLAQIDIDPEEIGRHYPVKASVCADAGLALRALLEGLPAQPRRPWAPPAPAAPRWRLEGLDLIGPLREALPRDAIVVADITRLSYMMLAQFPVYQPRTFLHPAGFVAMGYGIPAALGAKTAFPSRAVVAVVGDGCFLMSGMELATAVQERLPIIVVLINDGSLTLIKAIQDRRYEGRHLGVDLNNPDFQLLARAFGVRSWQVESDAGFAQALRQALALDQPALIEVRLPRHPAPGQRI